MQSVKIYKSIDDDIREKTSYNERWGDFERGLITSWESGRVNRDTVFHNIIELLRDGALPKLSFKGGHIMPSDDMYKEKAKYIYKYGNLNYLAQRQGLLNQDLDIDTQRDDNLVLVCSLTGLKTIFTLNINKYKENQTFNKNLDMDELHE